MVLWDRKREVLGRGYLFVGGEGSLFVVQVKKEFVGVRGG